MLILKLNHVSKRGHCCFPSHTVSNVESVSQLWRHHFQIIVMSCLPAKTMPSVCPCKTATIAHAQWGSPARNAKSVGVQYSMLLAKTRLFTWGQFWPHGIIVTCVCVCVCVCLRVCVCVNPELVSAISHHPFNLEPQNSDKSCKHLG